MKKYLLFLLFLLETFSASAQVDNYAFELTNTGAIDCGVIPSLNNLNTYTLQCWVSPTTWTQGAYILKRGTGKEQVALKLGSTGTLVYSVANNQLSISSVALSANKWAQITIMQSSGGVDVWVNNVKVVSAATSMAIPASEAMVKFGENYTGYIDEIRLWKTNIDTNYLLWQNTVNFFHPNYSDLIAYYKGDQKDCLTRLCDYMGSYHGVLSEGVTRKKVDNPFMEYKIVSAYTNITRFFDRNIAKENYLMANDIIILGIETNKNGEAILSTPNNHGVVTNGNYLENYKDRSGVISFNGSGSKMDAGIYALRPIDGWYKQKDQYSLFTWIYLESWTEGTFIFRKERSEQAGFSVRLGNEATHEVIVRLNGTDYTWKDNGTKTTLKTGQWVHFGVTTSVSAAIASIPGREKRLFKLGFDGTYRYAEEGPSTVLSADLTPYADIPLTIGENLNAKLDQTAIWHRENSQDYMRDLMANGMKMPSIGGYLGEDYAACVTSYYDYSNSDKVGYDSFSTDEFVKIMRSAFEGRVGYTIRFGISGHDGNGWQTTLGNTALREKMVDQIKAIVDATGVDGVETDMEWAYGDPGVTNYSNFICLLKQKMPNKIVTSSPHAVAYNLNSNAINEADRFSFQVYTNTKWFDMNGFREAYNGFLTRYPVNKIIMSYGATTSVGSLSGLENGYRSVIGYDPRPDVTTITAPDGNKYYVCSVNQVKERAQFIIDNKLPGMMYWDMGNDLDATDELSLCRAVNFVTASNVDFLYSDENLPSGNARVKQQTDLKIYPNPAIDYFYCEVPNDELIVQLSVFSIDGKMVTQTLYNNPSTSVTGDCQGLGMGIYQVSVKSNTGAVYTQKLIIK